MQEPKLTMSMTVKQIAYNYLYGNNKKPTREQLKGIDIIIFDIQDVGARFYTHFYSSLCDAAIGENNIKVIVLET